MKKIILSLISLALLLSPAIAKDETKAVSLNNIQKAEAFEAGDFEDTKPKKKKKSAKKSAKKSKKVKKDQ